jgi:hypothetical protein
MKLNVREDAYTGGIIIELISNDTFLSTSFQVYPELKFDQNEDIS